MTLSEEDKEKLMVKGVEAAIKAINKVLKPYEKKVDRTDVYGVWGSILFSLSASIVRQLAHDQKMAIAMITQLNDRLVLSLTQYYLNLPEKEAKE
jgi:hypothetical protein